MDDSESRSPFGKQARGARRRLGNDRLLIGAGVAPFVTEAFDRAVLLGKDEPRSQLDVDLVPVEVVVAVVPADAQQLRPPGSVALDGVQ